MHAMVSALQHVGALPSPRSLSSVRPSVRMQAAVTVSDVEETEATIGTPGQDEKARFMLDAGVHTWEAFQNGGATPTAASNMQEVAAIFARIASKPGGATYAAAHGLRSGYFITNALLGTAAFSLSKRVSGAKTSDGVFSIAGFGNSGKSEGLGGLGVDTTIASRLLLEAAMVYESDFEAVSAGEFKAPWDMSTLTHRQYKPRYALRQTSRFVAEAVGTLGRRSRASADDVGVWMDADKALYPEYYLNNFHYQTDGWLSSRSANVYETSTETLFVGRQDAMQRTALRPLAAAKVAQANDGAPRVLEVACGTGRFATFLRDNLPPAASLTAVDLSPFYLEKAKENDAYWRRTQKRSRARAGKSDLGLQPTTFVQANAESLPFANESFDAVVCVYLFHEMPKEARAAAALEMARVVAPGGTVRAARAARAALVGVASRTSFAALNR